MMLMTAVVCHSNENSAVRHISKKNLVLKLKEPSRWLTKNLEKYSEIKQKNKWINGKEN